VARDFIVTSWEELGRPCIREDRRPCPGLPSGGGAHRDERSVLGHGDVHTAKPQQTAAFKLIVCGLLAEAEYDLGSLCGRSRSS